MNAARKRFGKSLRVAVLLSVLAGVFLLFHWSRTADPRFYYFLTSNVGQQLGKAFRWQGMPIPGQHLEKDPSDYSKAEQEARESIETFLEQEHPSHRLTLTTGKELVGRVASESPRQVEFVESYGDSGDLVTRISRKRIAKLEALEQEPHHVSYQDVRFHLSFPDLNLYKRPPYTIATDENFFRVESAVRILQRLHGEFLETFGSLFQEDRRRDDIQVLFFAGEDRYRKVQKKYAPHMDTSVGFYTPAMDRFVVFNQRNSVEARQISQQVHERAEHYETQAHVYGGTGRIDQWKKEAGQRIQQNAEQQTRETLRHEGAHQLFFSYGVHSSHRIENEWLYEGLAVYCETQKIGYRSGMAAHRVKQALQGGVTMPLEQLVNHRSGRGFFGLGEEVEVDLAYAQSWSVVHFLMKTYQAEFFDYLRFIRDRENFYDVIDVPRYELLCRHVGLHPDEFQQQWEGYVQRL